MQKDESNEPEEENRRLTRTKQKNQQINDSKTDEPTRTKQKVQETTEPKKDDSSELPEENRRLTKTRQKAQEVESKKEEPSEPIEENRRLTRTTRKNQDSTVEDTGSKSDPKKSTMVESKVCIFKKLF